MAEGEGKVREVLSSTHYVGCCALQSLSHSALTTPLGLGIVVILILQMRKPRHRMSDFCEVPQLGGRGQDLWASIDRLLCARSSGELVP